MGVPPCRFRLNAFNASCTDATAPSSLPIGSIRASLLSSQALHRLDRSNRWRTLTMIVLDEADSLTIDLSGLGAPPLADQTSPWGRHAAFQVRRATGVVTSA